MPFEEMVPERGLYAGAKTLRFTGAPDETSASIVTYTGILVVAHHGLMDKKKPALSPVDDDSMPEKTKQLLALVKNGEVLAERQQPEPNEELITKIIQAVPICTTIAIGHPLRLRPLIPRCNVKFIELGTVLGWYVHKF